MSHIHKDPGQHDLTASAFIFRTDNSIPELLLHKHKLLRKYLQFGGHVELNETPWQSVIHEILEESGYDIKQLKLLQPESGLKKLSNAIIHPYPLCLITHNFSLNHFHTDISYAFLTDQKPNNIVSGDESKDTKLFSKSEISDLTAEDIYENVKEIALFGFDHVLKNWHIVDPLSFK